ncbi:MAG: sulfatase [Pirellulales bacterium]|nr:sulfatase [Pirellulales bacterium]
MGFAKVTRRYFSKKIYAVSAVGAFAMSMQGYANASESTRDDFAKGERPNFVIIMADDVSWDDFGCYGNPHVRTPSIDKLADNGIRFVNAYLTTSSCSPSRCSIITGRYPHNTGAAELHLPLPENQIPFPSVMKKAGYYTVHAGKWHYGNIHASFDVVKYDKRGDSWKNDPSMSGWFVDLIKGRPKDKPFFAFFNSLDAHRGWDAHLGVVDEENSLARQNRDKVVVPEYLADTPATRDDLAHYYEEIHRFDLYVGKVIAELEKQGVLDNTVVMVMADNGRPFPRCKTRLYDCGIKSPFVVHFPNMIKKRGAKSHALVSAIDIAPTILDLAGVSIPNKVQGRSFASLLREPSNKFRRYVFAEHNWHDMEAFERMVRSEDYMYIYNGRPNFPNCGPADSISCRTHAELKKLYDAGQATPAQADCFIAPRPDEELYDMREDSDQLNNLAANPKYETALEEMRKVMKIWQFQTCDSMPDRLTPDVFLREFIPKQRFVRDDISPEELMKQSRADQPGIDKGSDTCLNTGPF